MVFNKMWNICLKFIIYNSNETEAIKGFWPTMILIYPLFILLFITFTFIIFFIVLFLFITFKFSAFIQGFDSGAIFCNNFRIIRALLTFYLCEKNVFLFN